MSKWLVALMVLIAGVMFLQCSDIITDPNPVPGPIPELGSEPGRELTTAEKKLVESGNSFGLKFFRELAAREDPDSNLFVSPLSVAMALGMTYNGANGETQQAMQEVLELQGMTLEEVNQSYRGLIDVLSNLDPKVQFQIANSIWHDDKFSVEKEFLDLNKTYFDAVVQALDFNDPASVDIINTWVAEKTNDRIESIIDKIPPLAVMYLINAIYFKGDWSNKFDKEDTREAPFYLPDGSQTSCQMMYQNGDFSYTSNKAFSAVDLPYGDGDFSMTIFLPRNGVSLDSLIDELDDPTWNEWTSGFYDRELDLHLPKFKLEYEKTLNDVLIALGMEIAFDDKRADFTRINQMGGLYIDEVKHKTFLQVDEEGTEAAAVTSVGMFTTCISPQFVVDRPFLFAIRDSHSGTILFIGKITNPVWED